LSLALGLVTHWGIKIAGGTWIWGTGIRPREKSELDRAPNESEGL